MTRARILVAGIGNIFLGDDGFGCEVARQLAHRVQAEGVTVVDFGIRGFDLTYALLEDYDGTILIDATKRGRSPGTLYVIEPVPSHADGEEGLDMHGMHPERVMGLVKAMGGELRGVRLVGCEPAHLGTDDEMTMGLSPEVQSAIAPAIALVESLIFDLCERRAHA